MALDIKEFQKELTDIFKKIYAKIPDLALIVAEDAKLLIRNRIQERGITAEETTFPAYTPEYKKVKVKKFKAKNTSITNLTASGQMWRSWNIVENKIEGGVIKVSIGGTNSDSQNKINWNSERYGDITELSEKEKALLVELADEELQKIIDQAA